MSLRDYFAAQSMVALSCTVEEQLLTATTDADMDLLLTNAAALSYRIADAMLEARGK